MLVDVAERTKFYKWKQESSESVVDYVPRLYRKVQYCEFDKLKYNDPTDEMVKVSLVAELRDQNIKTKLLNALQ